jgi:hypothetical protein
MDLLHLTISIIKKINLLIQTILNQVPLGVNPITDGLKYGIFIVPSTLFSTCFSEYQIGHYLDNSGYTSAY